MTKDNNIKLSNADIEAIAVKVVQKMTRLKSMEEWFTHVSKSEASWTCLLYTSPSPRDRG